MNVGGRGWMRARTAGCLPPASCGRPPLLARRRMRNCSRTSALVPLRPRSSRVDLHACGHALPCNAATIGVEVRPLDFTTNRGRIRFFCWDTGWCCWFVAGAFESWQACRPCPCLAACALHTAPLYCSVGTLLVQAVRRCRHCGMQTSRRAVLISRMPPEALASPADCAAA